MNWLTVDAVILIHARVIEATGGARGVVSPGGLESSLARPFTTYAGTELYPGLLDKVGALIHSIIAFHPFVDGNKRTALVAADVCLRLNGQRLVPGEDVEAFFWAVARGEHTPESIAEWLGRHVDKYMW